MGRSAEKVLCGCAPGITLLADPGGPFAREISPRAARAAANVQRRNSRSQNLGCTARCLIVFQHRTVTPPSNVVNV